MNHKIAALYGELSIQKVVKVGMLLWAGYVVRMLDNNLAKLVFAIDPLVQESEEYRWTRQNVF